MIMCSTITAWMGLVAAPIGRHRGGGREEVGGVQGGWWHVCIMYTNAN